MSKPSDVAVDRYQHGIGRWVLAPFAIDQAEVRCSSGHKNVGSRAAPRHRAPDARLRGQGSVLRRSAGGRGGHDCGRLLAKGRRRPPLGLQDQRVRRVCSAGPRSNRKKRIRCSVSAGPRAIRTTGTARTFALCRAMRKVREEMGLENMRLTVPFCRTVERGHRVSQLICVKHILGHP